MLGFEPKPIIAQVSEAQAGWVENPPHSLPASGTASVPQHDSTGWDHHREWNRMTLAQR